MISLFLKKNQFLSNSSWNGLRKSTVQQLMKNRYKVPEGNTTRESLKPTVPFWGVWNLKFIKIEISGDRTESTTKGGPDSNCNPPPQKKCHELRFFFSLVLDYCTHCTWTQRGLSYGIFAFKLDEQREKPTVTFRSNPLVRSIPSLNLSHLFIHPPPVFNINIMSSRQVSATATIFCTWESQNKMKPIWTYYTSHSKRGNTRVGGPVYNPSRKYRPTDIKFVPLSGKSQETFGT